MTDVKLIEEANYYLELQRETFSGIDSGTQVGFLSVNRSMYKELLVSVVSEPLHDSYFFQVCCKFFSFQKKNVQYFLIFDTMEGYESSFSENVLCLLQNFHFPTKYLLNEGRRARGSNSCHPSWLCKGKNPYMILSIRNGPYFNYYVFPFYRFTKEEQALELIFFQVGKALERLMSFMVNHQGLVSEVLHMWN